MDTAPKKAEEPRLSYMFDAILEDDESQDKFRALGSWS